MSETPEQKQVQRELDDLVAKFMRIHGWDDTGVLTAYALVAHIGGATNAEGDDLSGYPVVYLGGTCPDHVAEGLFHMGIWRVQQDRNERNTDDQR